MGEIKKRSNHFFSRLERLVRSKILGFPFVVVNAFTKWEIHGKENLIAALEARRGGRGIVTVSNHRSLFDDPLVLVALLQLYDFSVETKCWWSTACASNFNPRGKKLSARFVRYFSDVSNMIFLSRAKKRGGSPPEVLDDPLEYVAGAVGDEGMSVLAARAEERGMDINSWLRTFYTKGSDGFKGTMAPLNQVGMVETISRVNAGQWVHLFPEGGRSRDVRLRSPRAGAGKVIYHADDAVILPLCFYGTQGVLPVGSYLPRLFKRVIVSIGQPISAEVLWRYRERQPSIETFSDLSRLAMTRVALLRPFVLERYFGARKASTILLEEAQLAMALQSAGGDHSHDDVFVEPYAPPAASRWGEISDQDAPGGSVLQSL